MNYPRISIVSRMVLNTIVVVSSVGAPAVLFAQPRPASVAPVSSAPPANVSEDLPRPHSEVSFSFDEALAAMRRAHPMLRVAQDNERAATHMVRAAGMWTNPMLNLGYTRAITDPSVGAADPILGYSQLGASQLIETAGVPSARRNAAEYERRAVHAEGIGTERWLGLDLRDAAIALVEAATRLEVVRLTATDLENADRIVNARVGAGAAPHYDASRIAVALAQARADVADAEADMITARTAFDVAVGPEAGSLQGLPRFDLFEEMPLPTLDELLSQLGETRPDVIAARERSRGSLAMADVARRMVFQGITVYGGVAIGGNNYSQVTPRVGGTEIDVAVGVAFPLPLVDRGQGSIPAAEARAAAQRDYADAVRLAAAQRVASTYQEVLRRRATFEAYLQTGAVQAHGMRREAEAGYREGRLSVLELVDAYMAVRDGRLRAVFLAYDVRRAEGVLMRAAGRAL